jgi:colicin import membrane protein
MIGILFFFPHDSSSGAVSYPVYTVDLVGGEKIGGRSLSVGVKTAPVSKKKPKRVKKKRSSRAVKKKKLKKNKRQTKVALVKKKTKKPRRKQNNKVKKSASQSASRTVLKESKERVKKKEQTEGGLSTDVRNRLIQAAVERVKQRAKKAKDEKSEVKEAGVGSGKEQVAAGPKRDGREGGMVRGVEFLIYRNRMLQLIKERWTWVGKRTDLEVTVHFGIQENGEVVKLRVVDASGDPSYDDSVIRAVSRASPLPPAPESYQNDFMNVELTFRPGDLSG